MWWDLTQRSQWDFQFVVSQKRGKEHEYGQGSLFPPSWEGGGQWLDLKRKRVEEGAGNEIMWGYEEREGGGWE
jgi:hypothetical protein